MLPESSRNGHKPSSMNPLNLDDFIGKVPDFPKPGVLFYDVTGILASPKAFQYCIDCMSDIYRDKNIDAVAAIEARGFLFAAPFALAMDIPLILIRKKGKLPGKTISKKYILEYTEAEIELHPHDVPRDKRILLMDDLIATGGTINAARELLCSCGAQIPEIFGIIGLPFLDYEKVLEPTPVRTLINYHSD